MKDTIWRYLEQYDLPVVVGHLAGSTGQPMTTQVRYLNGLYSLSNLML